MGALESGLGDSGDDGQEILLYDYARRPRSWAEIILPHQCAVFLRDEQLRAAVARDGRPRDADKATCILFDRVDSAERFCRQFTAAHPRVTCEVLDAAGRANPPLLIVTRDHAGGDEDVRGWLGRHRKKVIVIVIAAAIPLFWIDFRRQGDLVLTVLGINMIVAALRLLLWHVGANRSERERRQRLEAHRQLERGNGRS